MTGYQETVDRSELRRPARRVHGAHGRELRCRRQPPRVAAAVGEGGADAPLRRRGLGAVALLLRDRGPRGDRHPPARAADPGGRRDAGSRGRRRDRARPGRRRRPDQTAAGDGRPGAGLGRLLGRPDRLQRGRPGAGGGRRLRRQDLDHATAPACRRRGDGLSARGRSPTISPGSTASSCRTARATRSRSSRRSTRFAACSDAPASSASASGTSSSVSPPATRPTSCRSATVAPTTRCSSARRVASSSRARTTASPSRATDERAATYVSLYDGTVEGFDYPELNARSVQFHPEAGPGTHDAWPILESWVEGLEPA